MKPLLFATLFLLSLTVAIAQPKPKGLYVAPNGERRLALVVGNRDYVRKGDELTSTINDADDMTARLQSLGFTVIRRVNLSKDGLQTEIDEFVRQLANYEVGLFYYSGHGIRGLDGGSYLVPVDANMMYQTQVATQCVPLQRLLDGMDGAQVRAGLVFLDACRDNRLSSIKKGPGVATGMVVPTTNPPGTFVAFATRDGKPSLEVPGLRNSLFTDELLHHLGEPNVGIRSVMDQTTRGVMARCTKLNLPRELIQVPGRYDELQGDFVFLQKVIVQPAPTPDPKPAPPRADPKPVPVKPDLPPFMDMAPVPGGTFDMGSNDGGADEKPVHAVTVSGFQMGKYEVTVAQFAQFVAAEKYRTDAEKGASSYIWNAQKGKWIDSSGVTWRCGVSGALRPAVEYNHPMVHVSHNDAVAFCAWLTKREGRTYRLPTEAEWEFAARGGAKRKGYKFAGGNDANVVGWTWEKSRGNTHGVGEKPANELGLYDLTGNVWEWCSDWYDKDYYSVSSGSVNPVGPSTAGTYRVVRGGSWNIAPADCRTALRSYDTPEDRTTDLGFRVVSQ